MAHVLLFHHVMGLTDGVRSFAERLQEGGHEVTLPDLYGGREFHSIESGMEYAKMVGEEQLVEAGGAAARGLPADLVYAGFSMGVAPAMMLAQQRPGALGALLFHGIVPLGHFGRSWPDDVPLQIHIMEDDPYEDPEDSEEVRSLAEAANGELFTYGVSSHLFTDASRDGFDPKATDLVVERSLAFLNRL